MIKFVQINLKKAFAAAVELNRRVNKMESYIILASETYNFKGKIRSLPRGSRTISCENSRAALIFSQDIQLIKIEKLTNKDCAVGLLQIGREKVLIASMYLDIKEKVVQKWLEDVITFANAKKYALLIGMDSNAHSVLYGNQTNKRGEDIEEFIISNALSVENLGLKPTFEAMRAGGMVRSIIDVTLSRGLRNLVQNWHVDSDFNGSDHNTILFEYGQSKDLSLIHI